MLYNGLIIIGWINVKNSVNGIDISYVYSYYFFENLWMNVYNIVIIKNMVV